MHPCCRCEIEFNPADMGTCVACDGLVCPDCLQQSTGPRIVDYDICCTCFEARESFRSENEYQKDEKEKAKKAAAKARYNTPEAVAKRNAKRIENARIRAEQQAERRRKLDAAFSAALASWLKDL